MCNKFLLFYFLIAFVTVHAIPWSNCGGEEFPSVGKLLVRKDEREQLVSTEYGDVSAVEIGEVSPGQRYHLQFITLEPNALFLPVLLHADMVFYVQSGGGRLSWADEDSMRHVNLRRGDLYRLRPGTIFYAHNNLENDRQKLRVCAVFINLIDNPHEQSMGAYSSIHDLVLGFDKKVIQAAFQVPKEMIEELTSGTRQPTIVHAPTTEKEKEKEKSLWEIDSEFMEVFLGRKSYNNIFDVNKKKKSKTRAAFNLYDQKPDVKNCYGQSLIVNRKNLPALKGPNLSIFMVNLTIGSMMGPHWNPMASEVSIVLQGEGMIRIVGRSTRTESDNIQSTRFRVGEGDVFVVPKFHPMAQMAFTNDSFVFIGFSTTTKKNYPQFLSGRASVLRTLDREIVAASFDVTNSSTIDRFLDQQGDSVILGCTDCAEEEFKILKEEMERKREEEEKKRQEEEERKRKEEEEARRREEEARKRREEEEEKAKKQEEERKRQEEEEARKREEEEESRRKQEEEEERARKEEAKKQEEERQHREEEEVRKREEEEEKRHKQEEEEREEEEERARRQEEEEEEEAKRREKEARKKREEAARREEEAARTQEEEMKREAERREEEEAKRQEAEERTRREEEEEAKRQAEEEEARKQEEKAERKEKEKEREEEEKEQGEEGRGERERHHEETEKEEGPWS